MLTKVIILTLGKFILNALMFYQIDQGESVGIPYILFSDLIFSLILVLFLLLLFVFFISKTLLCITPHFSSVFPKAIFSRERYRFLSDISHNY